MGCAARFCNFCELSDFFFHTILYSILRYLLPNFGNYGSGAASPPQTSLGGPARGAPPLWTHRVCFSQLCLGYIFFHKHPSKIAPLLCSLLCSPQLCLCFYFFILFDKHPSKFASRVRSVSSGANDGVSAATRAARA